jgi:hypothetical protein
MTAMEQPRIGKKPEQEGGAGIRKDQAESEVEARGKLGAYVCYSCGQTNYCGDSWEWFTCSYCNAVNYTSPGLPR